MLIVDYLRARPNAEDTITGIAEWWVMRQRLHVDMVRLKQGIADLIASDVLEEVAGPAGPRYRLRRGAV